MTAAAPMSSDSTGKLSLAMEIGAEELPARFIDGALANLENGTEQCLRDLRLSYDRIAMLATPRRLIVMVDGLSPRQTDQDEWARGPSRKVAFDDQGVPTRAAEGFARGQGVAVDDLVLEETDQGEYVFARRIDQGRPAAAVLPQALSDLIASLQFPRSMRWGSGAVRFLRPVRWLLCLLNTEVLPVVFGDVTAGRLTWGHRTLGPGAHEVAAAGRLPAVLESAGVMASVRHRRDRIEQQAQAAAAGVEGILKVDDELLTEVVHLVEYPTVFTGSFAEQFLGLPAPLLVTVMKVHQRYFPVWTAGDGTLLPHFVGVRNGDDRNLAIVKRGNERVLTARLADARFFFEDDLQKPLADFVPSLSGVVFRERLGTLLDKTGRVAGLVGKIAARLDVPQEARARALRAAHLAKADQVTRVVYELPELEGIMGRHYALHSGEAAEVAEALREQYLPLPGQPELPQTTGGLLLAVADRADTLVGSFAIGLDPSGSQDPFGLRRLATGLLALCAGRGVTLPLDEIFEMALAAYGDIEGIANIPPAGGSGGSSNGSSNGTSTGTGDHEATLVTARLLEFCRIRLEGQMRDQGLAHDAVTAVLARGWTVIPHAWERARAVERLRQADYFDDVHIVFQRAHNLALKAPHDTAIRPDLFAAEAETGLYDALLAVAPDAGEHLAAGDHDAFFRAIARLRPAVDRFLDDVLVMAPEQEVQDNRLSLLRAVADLSGAVADLSKLVV